MPGCWSSGPGDAARTGIAWTARAAPRHPVAGVAIAVRGAGDRHRRCGASEPGSLGRVPDGAAGTAAPSVPLRRARLAPRPLFLPRQSGSPEHLPDRRGADLGQAALAQGAPQGPQRPRRRAVPLAIRRPARFRENALSVSHGVAGRAVATLSGKHRRHALAIEAGDQHRDRIAGSPTGLASGRPVAVLGGHRQQGVRPRDVAGVRGVRATDLLQLGSLFGGEFAQAAFLTTRPGGFLRHQSAKSTHEMAMGKPNAPRAHALFARPPERNRDADEKATQFEPNSPRGPISGFKTNGPPRRSSGWGEGAAIRTSPFNRLL